MKAWVATGSPGEPLTLPDVPEPALGPGEVPAAVEAYPVNRGVTSALNGVYETPMQGGWSPARSEIDSCQAHGASQQWRINHGHTARG
jgi:NADPH:quinone reductase-like Zn-dependent oxidoreductase